MNVQTTSATTGTDMATAFAIPRAVVGSDLPLCDALFPEAAPRDSHTQLREATILWDRVRDFDGFAHGNDAAATD